MEYRHIKKANVDVSSFGLGCMRLPTLEDKTIDEPAAIEMIRYAIDHGVNYIDTAYGYHDHQSEYLVGKALQDGYRDKTYLVTKCPVWLAETHEDLYKLLDEQLEKLQTDHLDFYLLHALSAERFELIKKLDYKTFLRNVMAQGKIRFPGFSFHGDLETFKAIVDDYDGWVEAQIQLNFVDTEIQAGVEGMEYAAARDLGVIIMEPLKGGSLVNMLPKKVEELLKEKRPAFSNVDWAMRFLYTFDAVKVILSGCSTMEQLQDHLRIQAGEHTLSEEEMAIMAEARTLYFQQISIPCTACRYCQPCPSGVKIPDIFDLYNRAKVQDEGQKSRAAYKELVAQGAGAENCVNCGFCVSQCPQSLEIPELLKQCHEFLNR